MNNILMDAATHRVYRLSTARGAPGPYAHQVRSAMSPVSRSRKPKKNRPSGKQRSGNPASATNVPALREHLDLGSGSPFARDTGVSLLQRLAEARSGSFPWFEPSIALLLQEAAVLCDAEGPRQLEDMTARLLGARVHEAVEQGQPLALGQWIGELIDRAEQRAREQLTAAAPGGESSLLLLHGLTSVGSPAIAHMASAAVSRLRPAAGGTEESLALPEWLDVAAEPRMTGKIWTLRDVYGSRLGVIADTVYPGGLDPAVYLFDIDACGFVILAGGGTYDDVEQAAAAWRSVVGTAAADAYPQPLAAGETEVLRCLAELDLSEMTIRGTESRVVWDEWFRALRRFHDVAAALERDGSALPAAVNLYHDIDLTETVDAFTAWLRQERGEEPDAEVVEGLVGEWLEGSLPDTAGSVSPHRIEHHLVLIGDFVEDHPVVVGMKRLLPDWVRFLAQRAGIPEAAAVIAQETLAAVSEGGHRAAEHCHGVY